MMRQFLMQAIADEPADGDINLGLAHQLAVMDDAGKETSEHQSHRYLGINPRPAVVGQ